MKPDQFPTRNAGRRLWGRWTGLILPGLLVSIPAFAQTNAPALSDHPGLSAPDLGVSLLRVMGALVLVIGLFLGGVWLLRNWQRLAVQRGCAPRLNILEVRSLGGRQSIYVVGYEQERFLLASSPAGVQFLTHLPADGNAVGETKPAVPFSAALARFLGGRVK